jgi:hypothetical protein
MTRDSTINAAYQEMYSTDRDMREYGPVARTYTCTWLAVNAPPGKLVTLIAFLAHPHCDPVTMVMLTVHPHLTLQSQ